MSRYVAGSLVRLTAAFTNAAGTPANPTAVLLRIVSPAGTVTYTYGAAGSPILTSGPGMFYADIDTTSSVGGLAVWAYEWSSTGAGQAAQDGTFFVAAPAGSF